jgi:hypothetical protein
MTEQTPVTGPAKVTFTGIFDLDEWYRLMYELFTTFGYEVNERKYKEKMKPQGKDIEMIWDCQRKVDDYTKFYIRVEVFGLAVKRVSVQKGGVEKNADKGTLEITFKSILITDYENRWETHPVLKFMKGMYDKYLYRPTFDHWKDKIYEEMYHIQNEVKAFFNLSRFM